MLNIGANRNIRPQMPPTAMIETTTTINPYLAMSSMVPFVVVT